VATHFSRLLRHAWLRWDYSYSPVTTRGSHTYLSAENVCTSNEMNYGEFRTAAAYFKALSLLIWDD